MEYKAQDFPPEIVSLIPSFLDRRRREIETLKQMLLTCDYDGIFNIAHKLRGNGESFGFPQISKIGASLEQAARAHDDELVQKLIETLDELTLRLKDEFV